MREQGMFDPARLALRHMAHAPLAAGATAMQPHHLGVGRGLINERQETITFVAALRWHGMRASQTIDGSMTGTKFFGHVERCLAPTLKRKNIVMIDNLPAHKAAGVREAIEARGATLRYLPKYSPDLNPIEMPFGKLKAPICARLPTHNSSPAPPNRQIRAYPHGPRSFQLFQARRLCVKSNGIGSSAQSSVAT